MWTRRDVAGMLIGMAAPVARGVGADGTDARRPGRTHELAALQRFAEQTHPRGREAAADADWRARWDAAADAAHDGEYVVRVRRALAWFRDGHTTVLPFEFTGGVPAPLAGGAFGVELPLRIRAFHDGAYVVAASPAATSLLGGAVESIGGRGVADLMRAVADTWPGNAAWAHRWAGSVLESPAQLSALGVKFAADGTVEIVAQRDGVAVRQRVARSAPGAPLQASPRVPAAYETWRPGASNFVHVLGDGCAYVAIDEMDDVEGKTFEAFTREVFAVLDAPGTRRLVLDLRRNGGGNNYFGEALRKRIGRAPLDRPGGLYVLIGPRTFSAAQNLATRLERETFARFVGEPTGGAPNHYGDARPFVGAATGITAIVSSLPWFDSYPQDARPWIAPDVPVPETFADWRDGRDRALDYARADTTSAPADELDRERIFFFRRASQAREWRPFWRA